MRQWDIYLIHHSHTDIGYTARQEKIMLMHADFIRQVLDILDKPENKDFKWQCENHWQARNFYQLASREDRERFETYVRSGNIGLSATYLNLTELADEDVVRTHLEEAKLFGRGIDVDIKAGMIADINGLSWGMADLMPDCGVNRLFSCLHSHHGMFPGGMKQRPFYWKGPEGNQLLVWNGEHYHFGNELHFAPRGGTSYMIKDELTRLTRPEEGPPDEDKLDEIEFMILETRLERYLANMEEEGYPWNFVPFVVSGAITDNAPPFAAILPRIRKLNERHPGRFNVKMATLDDFFARLETVRDEIPVYSGDWTDWWADGIGSTPKAVSLYKDAQRRYHLVKKLGRELSPLSDHYQSRLGSGLEDMMLFSEHTWGYSSSISEPWTAEVATLDQKKQAYAANAHTAISECLDATLRELGEVSIQVDRKQRFVIKNPHPRPISSKAVLEVEYWDSIEGKLFDPRESFELWCEEKQGTLDYQIERAARCFRMIVPLEMESGETLHVEMKSAAKTDAMAVTSKNRAYIGADGVADIDHPGEDTLYRTKTRYFELEFAEGIGLVSLKDRRSGEELIAKAAPAAPFTGVRERTDGSRSQTDVRRRMGRNRKAPATKRSFAVMTDLKLVENGSVYTTRQLDYELDGCSFWQVFIRAYRELPLIEVSVRLHKESCWDPENVYLALPFTAGENAELWMDKTAAVLRPGIDQLPGSNEEFWLGQYGLAWQTPERSLLLALKDAPLVTLGRLEAHAIKLHDKANTELNRAPLWNWLMNNFWETNFKAEVGGFYQFDYVLKLGDSKDPKTALAEVADLSQGLVAFPIANEA